MRTSTYILIPALALLNWGTTTLASPATSIPELYDSVNVELPHSTNINHPRATQFGARQQKNADYGSSPSSEAQPAPSATTQSKRGRRQEARPPVEGYRRPEQDREAHPKRATRPQPTVHVGVNKVQTGLRRDETHGPVGISNSASISGVPDESNAYPKPGQDHAGGNKQLNVLPLGKRADGEPVSESTVSVNPEKAKGLVNSQHS